MKKITIEIEDFVYNHLKSNAKTYKVSMGEILQLSYEAQMNEWLLDETLNQLTQERKNNHQRLLGMNTNES